MKRTISLVSALLCLALATGLAWADGEDDPAFDGDGTMFVPFGDDAFPIGDEDRGSAIRPRTAQAPDGSIITAIPLGLRDEGTSTGTGSRGSDRDVVRVTRADGSGKLAGFDGDGIVDLDAEGINDLVALDVLADGRIVIVTDIAFLDSRSSSRFIQIRTLSATGEEEDEPEEFETPGDCFESDAEPVAGDIAADGRVFVAWNCEKGVVVARYIGEAEESQPVSYNEAYELVVVDGNIFLLAEIGGFCCTEGRLSPVDATVVGKLNSDLVVDEAYGQDGFGAVRPGFPVDLTVGPGGEATVWTTAGPEEKGSEETRGDEPETWHFYNLDMAGVPDESFGDDGYAGIQHPDIGPLEICRRRGVCEAEIPQLIAQSDGKVIAIGYPPVEDRPNRGADGEEPEIPRELRDRTIIRLTTAGALDPTWDEDGVRSFALGQPAEGVGLYFVVGPPALQSDGKLLLPSTTFGGTAQRVPAPPDGIALGLSRIGLTPPAPPAPPGAAGQPAAATSTAAVVTASRSCVSRRVFRIRLRTGRSRAEQSAIRTARVTVNGKTVPVTAAQRRTAQVNLTGLPRGRFTVVISLTLADRGKVRDVRRYRTCAPKQERELPGLRTRKPKRG